MSQHSSLKLEHMARISPEVRAALRRNAHKSSAAFARGLRPPRRRHPGQWALEEAPIPKGVSTDSGKYDPDNNAPLREIEAASGPDDPCPEVGVIGAAQSGKSKFAENAWGHRATDHPGPAMWVSSTIRDVKDWAEEKLWTFIEASKLLRNSVFPLGGPANRTSTSMRVRVKDGGYLLLAGANSASGLRQHSIALAVCDEWDQWPDDCEGQGDPDAMVDQRLKTFRVKGLSKKIVITTPLFKSSRGWQFFLRSDQRYHYQRCQGCGGLVDWRFEDLKFETTAPHNPTLICPSCGTVHEEWQRRDMLVQGRNIATAPEQLEDGSQGERPPKYIGPEDEDRWANRLKDHPRKCVHLHGVTNQRGNWSTLVSSRLACGEDPKKIQTWMNLENGYPYELEAETPPVDQLEAIREQHWGYQTRGSRAPYGPAVFTLAVDVQGNGLWTSIKGWYDRKENWTLDREFLPGDTDVPGEGAWKLLDAKDKAGVVLSNGARRGFDMTVVDGGFNAEPVRHFVRRAGHRKAVKGEDGWSRPLWGQIATLEYQKAGKRAGQRARGKSQAHLIGTWPAKVLLAKALRHTVEHLKKNSEGDAFGDRVPFNFVHLCRDDGPDELAQITAASIVPVLDKTTGQTKRIWKKTGEDHLLDCDVYHLAAWDGLALDRHSPDDWARLRTARDVAPDKDQGDLFSGGVAAPLRGGEAALAEGPVPAPESPRLEPPRPEPPRIVSVAGSDTQTKPARFQGW